ncbi:golgin subfamily B member 1 isoform X1 [Tripterygium wilfordii]|uniref:Golgin subfamily B member 1 isoform X1 n=1 Tax=Tripterygium wilfordii TaxID=458696 RepID=A0A7J7CIC5_TRIWF|nr:interaptin-like [Tripterygium wilfordii]KAF5733789.1 golgin subfamily B member 1 isoform X1 [Tripterygium wilfordii]
MKKLFFFRSSNNGNNNEVPQSSLDKQVHWEKPSVSGTNNEAGAKAERSFRSPRGLFSKSRKQIYDSQSTSTSCSGLRKSRSLSSAAFLADGLEQNNSSFTSDQNISPFSSASGVFHQRRGHSSRRRALTPERLPKAKHPDVAAIQNAHGLERAGSSGSSRTNHDSSCSSNVSSKIVDRYIDGEQQQEKSTNSISLQRNHTGNGNVTGRLPPRVQYTAPTSPTNSIKDKPKSHSFREAKGPRLHFSSWDWVENGFGHESPRRLAKNVIERLSQTRAFPKSSSKDFDNGIPITIEDIYGGSGSRCFNSNSDGLAQKPYSLDKPSETANGYDVNDFSDFEKQNYFARDNAGTLDSVEDEDDVDEELRRRSKEAQERVMFLSEEVEEERFLRDRSDASMLIQTIRALVDDRRSLALEVSSLLHSRIADRASAKVELRQTKRDFESQIQRLEKERDELQLTLEKELDRRSADWSLKLEKYQSEEHRLLERVRELAEQNVSLQKDVYSFNERETESRSLITCSEQQLRDLTSRVEELSKQNIDLSQNLTGLQEKYKAAEEDLSCVKRSFEEKEKECKELQKSITRLLRTSSEQEKTIDGMREGFGGEIGRKQPVENSDKLVGKLQMEQMRLTGVELALRREVESFRLEVDDLRQENINLLNRLKGSGQEIDALTFKLDKEMWNRVCCLQNEGLSMLKENSRLCSKLLKFIKGKGNQLLESKQDAEGVHNGLDGQFIVESEMKIHGFKRGTEGLTRSLQNMSSLLQEKSSLVASKSSSVSINPDGCARLNDQISEETVRFELRAETLLTSLLREKLYSKELEVEQFHAELATAVRGNDILRCEVQNALDNLSFVTHKLKDLELQMLRKDENVSRLQSDLEESSKELTVVKGILSKVSGERDLMWQEVKQYNEKNMLLNSEVHALKKKIEALDEDRLLKEGQITILKDALGRPFDLLGSPDSTRNFLLT